MDPVGRSDGSLSITAATLITAWLALVTGSAAAAPPSNDNFANSITVSPIVTHMIGSTAEATLEGGSGEQAPSCQPSYGKSVWFYYAGAAIDVVLDLNTSLPGVHCSGGSPPAFPEAVACLARESDPGARIQELPSRTVG